MIRNISASTRQRILRSALEPLEPRQLLTTLVGGGIDADGIPIVNTFDYIDARNNPMRIFIGGDTTAEFVGAVFDDETGDMTLGDLTPRPAPNAQNPPPGSDLFRIHVTDSDLRSFIAVTPLSGPPNDLDIDPYSGNVELKVLDERGRILDIDTDSDTGIATLGARQIAGDDDDDENRPVLEGDLPQPLGALPAGPLTAGFVVENGNDFGRFLFAGTVMGEVRVEGSMETFYAGMLLTGDAEGGRGFTGENFTVDGDLRNLLVKGSIGTAVAGQGGDIQTPRYVTNFDFVVRGELGEIRALNNLYGSGDIEDNTGKRITRFYTETEARGTQLIDSGSFFTSVGNFDFRRGFVDTPDFFNDSFDSPQYLGTISQGGAERVEVQGTIQALDRDGFRDWNDYYAVPLLAGQALDVQLDSSAGSILGFPILRLGVFDPDGRLVASDHSNIESLGVAGEVFRFIADQPGVYRFAISTPEDFDYNGPTGEFGADVVGITPYTLTIGNTGELGVGGIVAGDHLYDFDGNGFILNDGDFGALAAGGSLLYGGGLNPSVSVADGNLRAITGGTIGLNTGLGFAFGAELDVLNGSVGLVQSNTGELVLNFNSVLPAAVGADYQMISAQGTLVGNMIADRRIGVIRAGDMATRTPSVITVNADRRGNDGIIDLIDVGGDVGTLNAGGPHITTGPGGNVRYFNVAPSANVYRDFTFGGGSPQEISLEPGEGITLNDDSGAEVTITPGRSDPTGPDTLRVLTYGIRGSGGVAIIRVTTDGSVSFRGEARSKSAGIEIGKVLHNGTAGSEIRTLGTDRELNTDPAFGDADDLVSRFDGTARIDVLNIHGLKFTQITNNTPGEIVSILAESIGDLSGQTLGLAKRSTHTAVLPRDILIDSYPFQRQRTGIIAADILEVRARGALGNIAADPDLVTSNFQNYYTGSLLERLSLDSPEPNEGNIGQVTADSDGRRAKNSFDGIAGPIYTAGNIGEVNFGAGIAYSGNGQAALAGVFAEGAIGPVRNQSGIGDIRGVVAAGDSIDLIDVSKGGSIINANIIVGRLTDAREFVGNRLAVGDDDSISNPTFELPEIQVEGQAKKRGKKRKPNTNRGGIIGTYIFASDIGDIQVENGFGIINSSISVPGNGVIRTVEGDGYGLRDVFIGAGARMGDLIARGNGKNAPVTGFSSSVRRSERKGYDPTFNAPPNRLTDLHEFLGTRPRRPSRPGFTQTGLISGVDARASISLDLLKAWEIRGFNDPSGFFLPTAFNFANKIETIEVARDISNIEIITGAVDELSIGRYADRFTMIVAGPIGTINVRRNFNSTSSIEAIGPDGEIDRIVIRGDMNGTISTTEQDIGTFLLGGDYNGDVLERGVRINPDGGPGKNK